MSNYFSADPWPRVTYLEAPELATVVNVAKNHPMTQMRDLFDSTFQALFSAVGTQGLRPIGPAFSLHHRLPTDTCDIEVGIPVDRPLEASLSTDSGITLTPSVLPAGAIAITSHLGAYDQLDQAWGQFLQEITAAGHELALPFWEIYVTEPAPDIDPATLRTDLVTRLLT